MWVNIMNDKQIFVQIFVLNFVFLNTYVIQFFNTVNKKEVPWSTGRLGSLSQEEAYINNIGEEIAIFVSYLESNRHEIKLYILFI